MVLDGFDVFLPSRKLTRPNCHVELAAWVSRELRVGAPLRDLHKFITNRP